METKIKPDITIVSGWWLSHPSEKYESVGMMTFPIEWTVIKLMLQTTNYSYVMLYHITDNMWI
jgi:hypothetical protein